MNTPFTEIENKAYYRLTKLYGDASAEALVRLEGELELLRASDDLTLSFYVAMRLCDFIKSEGHLYSYGGFVANSLLAYLLGITDIDPIKYALPPELICGGDYRRKRIRLVLKVSDIVSYDILDAYLRGAFGYEFVIKREYQNCTFTVSCEYTPDLSVDMAGTDIVVIRDANLTFLEKLSKAAELKIEDISLCDEKVFELINKQDTDGIYQFDNGFIKGLVAQFKPKRYEQLLQIISLGHSTDAWHGNAEKLYNDGKVAFSDIPASQDDLYIYLRGKGVGDNDAYDILRRFNGKETIQLTQRILDLLKDYCLDGWWLPFIGKVIWLSPKGTAISSLNTALRIAYFKANHRDEFTELSNNKKKITDIKV